MSDAAQWMYDHNYHFQNMCDFVNEKWSEISTATSQKWEEIKTGVSTAISNVKERNF